MLQRTLARRLAFFRFGGRDTSELSQEQIDSILMKPKFPQKQEQPQSLKRDITIEPLYYEKDINEIVDNIVKVDPIKNKVKESEEQNKKLKEQLEMEKAVQEIKYYKYELPIPNQEYDLDQMDWEGSSKELPQDTPVINIFEKLQMDGLTAYEEYEQKVVDFVKHNDMYGGQVLEPDVERKQIHEQLQQFAIPTERIQDEKYMEHKRKMWSLNLSMPGAIENEHPHRFLKLRPVEEFRHTPVIPISQKKMKDFHDMLERYHRGGFYFEVKREQVVAGLFAVGIGLLIIKMAQIVIQKEEETGLAYTRLKLRRLGLIQQS